ncbi:MAG: molybdopterin cofactor-binding domain-containing protein [Cyclobacteriaceae bacterium]
MKQPVNPTISRRKFMALSSASSAMLLIGCIPSTGKDKIVNLSDGGVDTALNQFISINSESLITLFNHRPEMGQGTFQSIPMILAEELDADINQVKIVQSEANSDLYGRQMVVGSHSIQSEFMNCRRMGAAARDMLVRAAAETWGVQPADVKAKNGMVTANQSGKTLTYGELVAKAVKLKAPENPKLKDVREFNIIGKPIPRTDIPLKTDGSAKFGIDIQVPGMLYASVQRSPVFEGKVVSFNEEEVLKMPGVTHVFKTSRDLFGNREGVAVLGESYWAAYQGRKALKIEWDNQGLEKISSETIRNDYLKASKEAGDVLHGKGDADGVFNKASDVIEAVYEMPYQAHVPMEPMNAVVDVRADSAEFWGSTQNPNGTRSYLARFLNLPEDKVKINYTFMGGGFGRRSRTDVAEEAADLSKKSGRPVKVIWTREDDQTAGPFRAASVNACRAVMKQGKIEALEHKIVAQEIRNQSGPDNKAGGQLMGGVNTDYAIPNVLVKGVLQKHHVPISYWRAVYHSTNPFAHESFIDELAIKAGKDPLEFRLEMMQGHQRFRRVLEIAAEVTDWKNKPAGVGRGVAIATRSGAHFAMVVDVERNGKGVKVKKITTALDLGICINPDTVKAQTEGSIVMGLGAALYGLTIDKGAIVEQNWHQYPLLRIGQCPEIETHIVKSEAEPDGAGESGLPTVAPALANAIYDLTGKRIRRLPIDLEKVS